MTTLFVPGSGWGGGGASLPADGSITLAMLASSFLLTSAYGGTGNGFTKFTGPTTSEKTFTLPNANATILTSAAVVTPGQGGTGVANNAASTITITGAFGITFILAATAALTVGATASVSGTNTGDQTISLTGDVTGSGAGSFAATIANDAVTYAKMQDVSATNRLLGRVSASSGIVEEVVLDTDTTLAANSDDIVATQKAVKAYVDASAGGGGTTPISKADGRLTLVTATPIMSTSQSGITTIYYTPFIGNQIALYNGSTWDLVTFAEVSLSLAGLTADKNYDIWGYNNAGTLTLEALVWTNDSTRATAIVRQDGVWSKTGALTRRLLGTIRINASGGQCDFILGGLGAGGTVAKLGVCNVSNARQFRVLIGTTTNSYTYGTATWREAEASGTFRVNFVTALLEHPLETTYQGAGLNTGGPGRIAVGYDSTSAVSTGGTIGYLPAVAVDVTDTAMVGPTQPAPGWHYVAGLERGDGFGSQTFYGDNGDTARYQSGMEARVWL